MMKEEEKLRNIYRRKAENSFQTVNNLFEVLASSQEITKVKKEYSSILNQITDLEKEEAIQQLNIFVRKYREVKGTSEFRKNVSKAVKEMKKKKAKEDRVAKSLEKALKEINDLETWVLGSKTDLSSHLETYLEKTKTTLGVRAQSKFSKELALYLARCNANHRDLSLSF